MLLVKVLAILFCFQIQEARFEKREARNEIQDKVESINSIPHLVSRISNLKSFSKYNLHDFHTSLTEIQYNPKEKAFEVSIRVFTDDFENALTKFNGGKKVFIGGKNDNADEVIKRYIPQHFVIITPQKQKKAITVLGKEIEGDATWIYVEIPDPQGVLNGTLQNDLLVEMFDDQTNLVNFFYNNQKKTFLYNTKTKTNELRLQ